MTNVTAGPNVDRARQRPWQGNRGRTGIGAAIGAVLIVGAAVYLFTHSNESAASPFAGGGKVKRVSGDRLNLVDGRHVELAGLRLPFDDEPLAAEARTTLAKWVQDEGVRLIFDDTRDFKKGRVLAYIYAN